MMKKYSRHYRRKVNYRNLLVVGLAGICAIAVLAGAGWFIYRTMFYDPFPQDESLTKSAGNVQQEIDEENGFIKLDNAAIPMNDIINIESEIFLKILDR